MIKYRVRLVFSDDIQRAIHPNLAYRGIQLGTKTIARNLVKTAKRGIRLKRSKTGRLYRIGAGRVHQASAPFEYPANLSGDLQKSVGHEMDGLDFTFGANTPYAVFLQQYEHANSKTPLPIKMKPRPYLTKAHDENKATFVKVMETSFAKLTGFKEG